MKISTNSESVKNDKELLDFLKQVFSNETLLMKNIKNEIDKNV